MHGSGLSLDVAHMLAGGMVALSFALIYQDRLFALLNVLALQALALALALGWQGYIQNAPDLYVTAALAFLFKAVVVPMALHRLIMRLRIHRTVENAVGVGMTMLLGVGLVALSILVMMPLAAKSALIWEDLSFALAVILLGLLLMISRRNAVSQIVGFISMENGLMLAAAGARGMPLVIEISISFSALIALIVFGVSVFRIRERFESVDVHCLHSFRGDAGS
ncbi:hydrogenase-4 component E [Azospirillaceae bacterium]